MIGDRYDSSNDMNPTISPFNHPEVPYIYEMNFSKFEKSLIDLIESNLRDGKLFCHLDISGNGKLLTSHMRSACIRNRTTAEMISR